jgi:alpha-glucosidase
MRSASRWLVVSLAVSTLPAAQKTSEVRVTSPDRRLILDIKTDSNQLLWNIAAGNTPVIEPSALGIVVDGVDLGKGSVRRAVESYKVDDSFPWRGGKSEIKYRANGVRIRMTHTASRADFTIEAHVSDDAAAIRFVVPGAGSRVPDAGMAFRIPARTLVWSHGLRDHYEALYVKKSIEQAADGEWAAPPVTFKLPAGGYAAITESNLRNYAGMALQADGQRGYFERLGHSHPP